MNAEMFEKLVFEAIDNIPEQYKEKIDNISFQVMSEPSPEQRQKLGLRDCDALFGLYEGVPLTRRGGAVHAILPDVITIFEHPMIDIYKDHVSLKKQIYETVWHEVAHYFGLGHTEIDRAKRP